jgi:hypothetical protein
MSQRHIVSAFLKGVAVTPLGSVIGTVIALALLTPDAGDLGFVLTYGVVIGCLFAAPATIVLFPVLYAIWPKRTWSAFIYVMIFSAIGGFFSPLFYLREPPSMILDSFQNFLGLIGMVSAAVLAPLYFHWTRRPGTIGEPQR